MSIKTKSKKLVQILSNDGPIALAKAFNQYVKRKMFYLTNTTVEEADIAFKALNADRESGVMIDVGGHIGKTLLPFANNGWRVFAFEPDPVNRAKLVEAVKDLPNVSIDSRAVSDVAQENVTLFRSEQSTGITSLSSFHHSHRPDELVSVTTLGAFIKESAVEIKNIDFLKIDTEGFDFHVLKGIPWGQVSVRMILSEFEDSKTKPLGYTFDNMADYLIERGYKVIVSEWFPIKEYGGMHSWRRFAKYPCKLEDANAWGNILATKEDELYDSMLKICGLDSN